MAQFALAQLVYRTGFCDPAGSGVEGRMIKRGQAKSSIVVVGMDALARVFVLSSWADRCPTPRLVERIIESAETWGTNLFGIEANAMQALFADMVLREARILKKRVSLTPVQQPTRLDKDFRIRTILQPVIGTGRLFIQAGQRTLRTGLEGFPHIMIKDEVDALASAVNLLPQVSTKAERDGETERYLAYLRESGAPASYITQQAESLNFALTEA